MSNPIVLGIVIGVGTNVVIGLAIVLTDMYQSYKRRKGL